MDAEQELTHTVTTTVSSTRQQIVNEIKLTDGDTVVLETTNKVNLENGKTYLLDAKGEIDGRLIRRVLNVANNLIGTNAFDFKQIDGTATDGSLAAFTAQYDPAEMKFNGTAPVGSTVRILLEDGRDLSISPTAEGRWEQQITAAHLQLGVNNIFVINGSGSNQVLEFIITHADETPLDGTFDYSVSADGKTVSGTAADKRASVVLQSNGTTYSAKVNPDGKYSIAVTGAGLTHGAELRIWLQLNDIESVALTGVYFRRAAQLDNAFGQRIYGTAHPGEQVDVTTAKYGETAVIADAEGEWEIDFPQGLGSGVYVVAVIGGTQPIALQYTGANNAAFELTGAFVSAKKLAGTAAPYEALQVQVVGSTVDLTADEVGAWSVTLEYAVANMETAVISASGSQINVTYEKAALIVSSISANQITGTAQYGDSVTVATAGQSAVTVQVELGGIWNAYFVPALTNPAEIDVTDSTDAIHTVYVKFTAKAVNSVQLEGIARAGSIVSAGGVTAEANEDHYWKLILTEALQVGESIQVINNGVMKNATYKPEFTAYIGNDGLSVLGTSPETEVTVTAQGVDAVVPVINGEYTHALTEALNVGEVVTIESGTALKTVTYTGLTSFTAELNPEKNAVLGDVDAPAKIRAVFTDNSMIEIDVPAGSYALELGRTLVAGVDVLVVACIANNALYQAITLDA